MSRTSVPMSECTRLGFTRSVRSGCSDGAYLDLPEVQGVCDSTAKAPLPGVWVEATSDEEASASVGVGVSLRSVGEGVW